MSRARETPPTEKGKRAGGAAQDSRSFLLVLAGLILTIAAAFGLGFLLNTPALAQLSFDARDAATGAAATAPLVAMLAWMMRTHWEPVVRFRQSQIELFSTVGFAFTPWRIAVMSIGAGVSEELLFRGVLQDWADRFLPLWAALAVTNLLFGALHARNAPYAVIAGLVGVYFGVLFAATSNLLAPMIAHALYDAVAFEFTRRAIARSGAA